MKYALIGCGRIAANHIKAAKNNGLELAAVCDTVPENMESLLAGQGLSEDSSIRRYTDYKKMIEEEAENGTIPNLNPEFYQTRVLDGY